MSPSLLPLGTRYGGWSGRAVQPRSAGVHPSARGAIPRWALWARPWPAPRQWLGGTGSATWRCPRGCIRAADTRLALTLPGLSGLWDGLIRAGLVLAPQRDAHRFGDASGEVDHA